MWAHHEKLVIIDQVVVIVITIVIVIAIAIAIVIVIVIVIVINFCLSFSKWSMTSWVEGIFCIQSTTFVSGVDHILNSKDPDLGRQC